MSTKVKTKCLFMGRLVLFWRSQNNLPTVLRGLLSKNHVQTAHESRDFEHGNLLGLTMALTGLGNLQKDRLSVKGLIIYSPTCIKQAPKGQPKSACLIQVLANYRYISGVFACFGN